MSHSLHVLNGTNHGASEGPPGVKSVVVGQFISYVRFCRETSSSQRAVNMANDIDVIAMHQIKEDDVLIASNGVKESTFGNEFGVVGIGGFSL